MKRTINTKYYTVVQNNVYGYYLRNEDVQQYVCVEAIDYKDAKRRLEEIVANYNEYCPCCGNRWDTEFIDEEDGYDTPSIYGEPIECCNDNIMVDENSNIIIYHIDGKIDMYNLKRKCKVWLLDYKYLNYSELKNCYHVITGLDNYEDFSDEELYLYLIDVLRRE